MPPARKKKTAAPAVSTGAADEKPADESSSPDKPDTAEQAKAQPRRKRAAGTARDIARVDSGDWIVRPEHEYEADSDVSLLALLCEHGWTTKGPDGEQLPADEVCAPGDVLAVMGSDDNGEWVNVPSGVAGMPVGRLSKFDAFRLLVHNGDNLAALRALRNDGYGRSKDPTHYPSPYKPNDVAEQILDGLRDPATRLPTYVYWQGKAYRHVGTHWAAISQRMDRAILRRLLRHAVYQAKNTDKDGNVTYEEHDWNPVLASLREVEAALHDLALLDDSIKPGDCIGHGACVPDGPNIPMRNGVYNLPTRKLLPHSPALFNVYSIPYDYVQDAGSPRELLKFLKTLKWADDDIAVLQEWLGYLISGRTDLQKFMILQGKPRAGKGTLMRLMSLLVGARNSTSHTATSIVGGKFALFLMSQALLCTMGDVHVDGRSRGFTELLKSATGEDDMLFEEKYGAQFSMKMPARICMACNGLPRFADVSGVIADRPLILRFTESFLDNEDLSLGARLAAELPAIFEWALEGLSRLEKQGAFTKNKSAQAARDEMRLAASPVLDWVQDKGVEFGDASRCTVAENVFAAWRNWCLDNGREHGSSTSLGIALHELYDGLEKRRVHAGDKFLWSYVGVVVPGVASLSTPARRGGKKASE